MLNVYSVPACCGAIIIHGFNLDFSYQTGRVNSSEKYLKSLKEKAEISLKKLINSYCNKAQILVFLNVPQKTVYGDVLTSLGFLEVSKGENYNHIPTSPISTYILSPVVGGEYDGVREKLNSNNFSSVDLPERPVPFPEVLEDVDW